MADDLRQELETLKQTSFGSQYKKIRQAVLEGDDKNRQKEFSELEDAFFYLLTIIVENQNPTGWWNVANQYQRILTAHAIRHLYRIGIPLSARWNLHGRISDEGNLLRAVKQLLKYFHDPEPDRHARWDVDVWDDCYILMALLEVGPDFQSKDVRNSNPTLADEFENKCLESLQWLEKQFDASGFNQRVQEAEWYGPGFYAAAIELFSHSSVKEYCPKAEEHVTVLATAVKPLLEQGVHSNSSFPWKDLFAWHVGQFLVTWKEKSQDYAALRELDDVMKALLEELKKRQSDSGAWLDDKGPNTREVDKIYYTVRALTAFYVNTDKDKFLACEHIKRAHNYLLEVSRNNAGLLIDLKGSINALEAFQKLFDFRFRNIFPNLLIALSARVNKLGLLDDVLNPCGNDSGTLKKIRASARMRLEAQGKSGLELLGVNDQLYQALKAKNKFLEEFSGDRNEILRDLRHFLSATLTETRSKLSRSLIKSLWHTDGFLNFIPLIEHLSELEQDRAFYKYYRDHLNHEVLLFLLGAYIYDNCQTFRQKIDDEIKQIWDEKEIRDKEADLPGEFLFRWKLISTFHDIGYLFEVDPDPVNNRAKAEPRTKEELLKMSFNVVDEFRKDFLFDYFMQYVKAPRQPVLDKEQAETAREEEVRRLAEEVGKILNHYPGTIQSEHDLFKLSSVYGPYSSAFTLISQYVKPGHISKKLIAEYFELCNSEPVFKVNENGNKELKNGQEIRVRGPFLDHGIMSALVLLKAADVQRHYLKELTDKDYSGTLLYDYPQLRDIVKNPKTEDHLDVRQFFIRFSHVAGAIALHNISPRLYSREQCENFDQEKGTSLKTAFYTEPRDAPGRYIISFDENPLSYLTALADTLQDWDRHSFRRLSFGEESGEPLASSEVVIDASDEDNRINVKPLTTEAREKYLSMAKGMNQYLLKWDDYVKVVDNTK